MDVEEKARTMGWVPKEEFRGDPEKWIEAGQFVERGDNIMPILKERMGKFEERIDHLVSENQKLSNTVSNMVKLSKTASERAYKKAVRDLKNQQRQAVADGDTQTFDRLQTEIDDAEKSMAEETGGDTVQEGVHPDYTGWVKENQWYMNDEELSDYADFIGNKMAKQGLEGRQLYDKVAQKVKKQFPEKFENPNRSKPASVEGGGSEGGDAIDPKNKKTYKNLPADAKAACDRYVEQKLMTREQYVNDYFEGEE